MTRMGSSFRQMVAPHTSLVGLTLAERSVPHSADVTAINLVAGRVEIAFSISGGAGSSFNGTSGTG